MRKRFVLGVLGATALLCGTASCAFAPPHPGKHELRAVKHGRIVDADTGAGIADANVIAVWRQHSSGVSDMVSGGSWCNLQRIVVTDSDGRYTIPDVSHELDAREMHFGPLSLNKLWSDWLLIVFKPGYVRAGDLETLPKHEKEFFLWQVKSPETYGLAFGKVDVKTIAMKKVDLDAPNLLVYDSAILSTAGCSDSHGTPLDEPELGDIAKTIIAVVRPIPCAMPPEMPISVNMLNGYTNLVHNPRFDHRIVEAVGQREWGTKGTTAGVLCNALTGKEKGQ